MSTPRRINTARAVATVEEVAQLTLDRMRAVGAPKREMQVVYRFAHEVTERFLFAEAIGWGDDK